MKNMKSKEGKNSKDLLSKVAENPEISELGINRKTLWKIVKVVLIELGNIIVEGNFQSRYLGTFKHHERKAQKGRSLVNGEETVIPKHTRIGFKPIDKLRERLK